MGTIATLLGHADVGEYLPDCSPGFISWNEMMDFFFFQPEMFEKPYTQQARIAFVIRKKATKDFKFVIHSMYGGKTL